MIKLIKKDIVLSVSFVLALISAIIVPPTKGYLSYIDFRVLILLYSLMVIVKAFQNAGVFDLLVKKLTFSLKNQRSLCRFLVFSCLFFSMLMTNDVALITFVPFGIYTLTYCGLNNYIITITVLETIAANLGSLLTPIGNPQNLYLYSISNMEASDFFLLVLPYFLLSVFVLLLLTFLIPKTPLKPLENDLFNKIYLDKKRIPLYIVLFLLMILTVLRVIPHIPVFLVIILTIISVKKSPLLLKADFGLLFTFVFLFIFVGNMGTISIIEKTISEALEGREIIFSALLSQVISNVPCAMLLSKFTEEIPKLIIGTNIGGLGTLIASMASVISFKIYSDTKDASVGKYIITFSIYNFSLLILFLGFALVLN